MSKMRRGRKESWGARSVDMRAAAFGPQRPPHSKPLELARRVSVFVAMVLGDLSGAADHPATAGKHNYVRRPQGGVNMPVIYPGEYDHRCQIAATSILLIVTGSVPSLTTRSSVAFDA